MKNTILISSLLFIFASCGLTTNESESQVKEYVKSYKNCDYNSSECTYVKVTYPYFSNENAEMLNSFVYRKCIEALGLFNETNYNSIDDAADAFLNDYAAFNKDFPENEQYWYLDYVISNLELEPNYICLKQEFTSYTGGAHGNYTELYTTFDKQTAKQLSLNALFESGYSTDLAEIITHKYKLDNGLTPADALTSKSSLFVDTIEPTENFFLTSSTITFIYNPYDIAPYSEGLIQVEVPLENVKHLIKKQSFS